MKPETIRNEIIRKGLVMGVEFAFSVIALIFLGYFLGSRVSNVMAMIGMIVGAFLGFVLGIHHMIKRVS